MGTRASLHPERISIGSSVFAQLSRVPNTQTHTQTDHAIRATSAAIGHIYALRAGDAVH